MNSPLRYTMSLAEAVGVTAASRDEVRGGGDAGVGVGFDVHAQGAGFRIGPNSSSITHGDTRSVWLPAKDRMTGVFWTIVLFAVSTRAMVRSPPSAHIPDDARRMRGGQGRRRRWPSLEGIHDEACLKIRKHVGLRVVLRVMKLISLASTPSTSACPNGIGDACTCLEPNGVSRRWCGLVTRGCVSRQADLAP